MHVSVPASIETPGGGRGGVGALSLTPSLSLCPGTAFGGEAAAVILGDAVKVRTNLEGHLAVNVMQIAPRSLIVSPERIVLEVRLLTDSLLLLLYIHAAIMMGYTRAAARFLASVCFLTWGDVCKVDLI